MTRFCQKVYAVTSRFKKKYISAYPADRYRSSASTKQEFQFRSSQFFSTTEGPKTKAESLEYQNEQTLSFCHKYYINTSYKFVSFRNSQDMKEKAKAWLLGFSLNNNFRRIFEYQKQYFAR